MNPALVNEIVSQQKELEELRKENTRLRKIEAAARVVAFKDCWRADEGIADMKALMKALKGEE